MAPSAQGCRMCSMPIQNRQYPTRVRCFLIGALVGFGLPCGVLGEEQLPSDTLYDLEAEGCYNESGAVGPSCPMSCPYLAKCSSGDTTCVRGEDCTELFRNSFSNEMGSQLSCASCQVNGCAECLTADLCKTCHHDFTLQPDGSCSWNDLQVWSVVGGSFCLLALWVIAEFTYAHWRETTNLVAVKAGLASRSRAKTRCWYQEGRPFYNLWVPMNSHVRGVPPIGGPGLPLFLNWFVLVLAVAAWLSILAIAFASQIPKTSVWEACNLELLTRENNPLYTNATLAASSVVHYPWWSGLSYIGATLISIAFFVHQSLLWNQLSQDSEGEPFLSHYAVRVSGFPPDAIDKEELMNFFAEELRAHVSRALSSDAIVHISIGYAFSDSADLVAAALDEHLRELEDAFDDEDSQLHGSRSTCVTRSMHNSDSSSCESEGNHEDAGPFWVQLLGYVALGINPSWSCLRSSASSQRDKLDLDAFQNSGRAIVVLRTKALAIGMSSLGECGNLFRGKYRIKVKKAANAPLMILWENFTPRAHQLCNLFRKSVMGAGIIFLTLLVWFLIYAPFFQMTISTVGYSGTLVAVMLNVLSLMIAAGNALISSIVELVTRSLPLTLKSHQLVFKLMLIVPCVFINCFMDFVVVSYAGLLSFTGGQTHTSVMEELSEDWLWLLFPSYVLMPYVAEPFCTILFTRYLGIWRIKRDSRIDSAQAERALIASETDIVNPAYCDIICTSTVIMVTFMLAPGKVHRIVFPLLGFFASFLYCQVRVRILRWESSCYYASKRLDECEAYFWALPLAVLAAAFERQFKRRAALADFTGLRWFIYHIVGHILFLKFVLPTMETQLPPSKVTYEEARKQLNGSAALADYLNTNPIEVLKSLRHSDPAKRLVYYRRDKEYLQRRSAKLEESGTMNLEDGIRGHLESGVEDVLEDVLSAQAAIRSHAKELRHERAESQPLLNCLSDASVSDSDFDTE